MKSYLIAAALGATTLGGLAYAAQPAAPTAAPARPDRPHAMKQPRRDANGDGVVTRDEMLGPVDRRFDALDTNRDGQISRAEFRARALDRFARVDTNRDGRIDAAERQAMRAAHPRRGPGMRHGGGWGRDGRVHRYGDRGLEAAPPAPAGTPR